MDDKRILITGCHGLLGQRILQSMSNGSGSAFIAGVDLDDAALIHGEKFRYSRLDIRNRKEVAKFCEDFKPDLIINTAALNDVDKCEIQKEDCWRVNVEGVENLAKYAKKHKAKLIHFSTDYIFDNSKTIYTEDDRAAPLSYFGRSKLASENVVRSCAENGLIIRSSMLYDVDRLKNRSNFVVNLIDELSRGSAVDAAVDRFGNPTLVRNLAESLRKVTDANLSGVFHIAGKDIVDNYTFSIKIAKVFKLDERLIKPVVSENIDHTAEIPGRIGLDISKAEKELGLRLSGINNGLAEFKNEYYSVHSNN